MRISQRSIEDVREAANIVEVASEFTALRRQGARFSGLCPYPDHQEKSPSFSVSPDRGFYYCFGCQKGGDAIKLVTDLKGLSFAEAVSYLAERSGVDLQFEGGSDADSKAARERNLRRRNVHKALAAAAVYYHKYLIKSQSPEAAQARQYLEKRGLELSTIEEFRLGYAPPRGSSGFLQAARRLDLGRPILDAAGLLSSRGGERFAGRITFPISDRRGRIVGFGARALGDDHPKYLNSPETEVFNKRELLYGFPQVADAIRKERAALIVEGYTDVLMLYQSGIENAVATLGTATTSGHLKTLSGFAEKIFVLFDPDAAGEKAIERAASTAADLRLDLRVLRLPEDPADWLLAHPAEEFAGMLSGAVPVLEYIFGRKAEAARGASAAERSRMLSEVSELINAIEDPVFRGEAVRRASEAFGVSPDSLQSAQAPSTRERRARSERPGSTPYRANTDLARVRQHAREADGSREAERLVLALALTRPDVTGRLFAEGIELGPASGMLRLRPEDFADTDRARIFTVVGEYAGGRIEGVFSDERLRPVLDEVAALTSEGEKLHQEQLYDSETSIHAAWLRLAILSRQRAKREASDFDVKQRLHDEIQVLNAALRAAVAEP